MSDYEDDTSIPDDEILLRRIPINPNQLIWDENQGRWRPSSSAFQDHPDGSPMSIDIESKLFGNNLTYNDAVIHREKYLLASITAGEAREQNQYVISEPILENIEEGIAENPAHGVVFGSKRKAKKKLAKCAAWVIAPNENDINSIKVSH